MDYYIQLAIDQQERYLDFKSKMPRALSEVDIRLEFYRQKAEINVSSTIIFGLAEYGALTAVPVG